MFKFIIQSSLITESHKTTQYTKFFDLIVRALFDVQSYGVIGILNLMIF